ncbi:ATP-binding protein [Natrarchaeobaculum aegyptiacum]|nr:AAA family ATPase [Natrarchaeobaculum aegyptiacum]
MNMYTDAGDHLRAEFERIGTVLECVVETEIRGEESNEPGRLVGETRLATFTGAEPPPTTDAIETAQQRAETIEERIAESRDEAIALPLDDLCRTFDLSREEKDVLLFVLAPEIDRSITDIYGRLDGSGQALLPTVAIVERLLWYAGHRETTPTGDRHDALSQSTPLFEYGIVDRTAREDASPSRLDVLSVDDRIVEFLQGDDSLDLRVRTRLERETRIQDQPLTIADADASLEELLIAPACRAELEALPDPDGRGRRVYVHGPEGAGMHRAVEAVCESDRLLRADLRAVLAADALEAVVREARLVGLPLVLHHADQAAADADQSLEAIVHRVGDLETDLYVVGRESWTPSNRRDRTLDAIQSFSRPTIAQRREFWTDRADQFAADIDPERLASTFDLTQGQLEAALTTARTLAADGEPTVDDIRAGCRAQSADALEDLAQHVEPDLSWDDIKLGDETRRQLETLEAHVTNRGRIYDDWGFRDRDKNAGVVALFKGLPGTGKTMAAEVLAKEVGMDVYKIDLSSVVSKYIGETEENLEEIFQAAEQSNAILLFDEADSIFGDRAEVSDATDRYANVEVNYLLQRIEHYDGIIVLTTNYAQNIDTAFSRRITHTIRFEKPDAATRRAIWESIFPPSMPVENIDTEWLADFEYSGGTIDNLAKHIAIYAAEADAETITMRHVVEALEQYKRDRNSRIQDRDFEPYLEYLQGPTEREQQQQRHRIRHDEN